MGRIVAGQPVKHVALGMGMVLTVRRPEGATRSYRDGVEEALTHRVHYPGKGAAWFSEAELEEVI